jgi:HAD superfamily hydrolase (TIGR01484 family)
MRPISELPRERALDLRGVVFDVDDTLTRGGVVERDSYDALFALRDAGLFRVAVTGRPLGFAEVFAQTWPVDLAIGENGAGWFWRDAEGRLGRGHFDDSATRAHHRTRLDALRGELLREVPAVREVDDRTLRHTDIAYDVNEHDEHDEATITDLANRIEARGMKTVRSSVHLHAVLSEANKANGTKRAVREVLGVDLDATRNQWIFVGDSANDAPAFAYFDLTAAPSNVAAHLSLLPNPPRYVAAADRGKGFAEIVAHILELRR